MKITSPVRIMLGALAVVALGIAATPAASAARSKPIDIRIVAEQTDEGALARPPSPEQPTYYEVYDAGLIEAGDSVGGDEPPTAPMVAQALHNALESQSYRAATPATPPTVDIIYHWGAIRPVSFPMPASFKIDPNLKARLALVAPSRIAASVENYLLSRKYSSEINRHFPTPAFLGPDLQNALDLANDRLYFVAISAYDHEALQRGERTLLWRAKLTARDVAGSMGEVVLSMIGGAARYFGGDFPEIQSLKVPVIEPSDAQTSPPDQVTRVPSGAIKEIIKQEHDAFSGEFGASLNEKPRRSKAPPARATQANLPAALVQRVATYSSEKSALQAELVARIKGLPPGSETRRAIDAFNSENASRIAALGQARESIRAELAALPADSQGGRDKSLDALRREFAAGVENIENPHSLTPRPSGEQ